MDAARWPQVFRVRQQVVGPLVDDVAGEVEAGLAGLGFASRVAPGDTVAIAAGSRGIADVAEAVRAVARHFRRLGTEPFVVPAMGSHGGGTAEGQRETLAARGISEASIGCPVRSSMRTVEVGRSAFGFPLLLDAHAAAADHVVVVNRVKPHTMFSGEIESGLSKMVMLGLGKRAGAATYHGAIHDHGWMEVVRDVVPRLVGHRGDGGSGECGKVVAGVALVERGDDRTARVAVVAGDRFLAEEPALLRAAREWMAKLPFADVDLLLVDRIGKDVSGAGLDVNVVGRKGSPHESHDEAMARVRTIAVRGLTDATHGNALGIGLAELCRSRVLEQMDAEATRINALTAGDVPAAMAPLDYRTDAEMISVALGLIGLRRPAEARVSWVRDTLHLDEALCSVVHLDEALDRDDLDVISEPFPLPLDGDGNLPDDLPPA